MQRLWTWIREHKAVVFAGVAGTALALYILWRARNSSSQQPQVIAATGTPSSVDTSGGSSGALNLSSGTQQPLSTNLVPPNCGPGMIAVPTSENGGSGQPSYLFGWTCQPSPTTALTGVVRSAKAGTSSSAILSQPAGSSENWTQYIVGSLNDQSSVTLVGPPITGPQFCEQPVIPAVTTLGSLCSTQWQPVSYNGTTGFMWAPNVVGSTAT